MSGRVAGEVDAEDRARLEVEGEVSRRGPTLAVPQGQGEGVASPGRGQHSPRLAGQGPGHPRRLAGNGHGPAGQGQAVGSGERPRRLPGRPAVGRAGDDDLPPARILPGDGQADRAVRREAQGIAIDGEEAQVEGLLDDCGGAPACPAVTRAPVIEAAGRPTHLSRLHVGQVQRARGVRSGIERPGGDRQRQRN